MPSGASLSHVSQYNENAVFHALRALGPTSQTDIAAHTGLSVPAVSSIVRNLRAQGYLTELRTESVGRGRPRVIVDLVPTAAYSAGLQIDPTVMSAVVLNLQGEVVEAGTSEEVNPRDAVASLDAAAALINGLITTSGIDRTHLLGACAAVPGPLDDTTGSILDTVWMPGWAGTAIGQALTDRLHTPVPVLKDTLAAVIGENWVRAGGVLDSTMIFVYLGTGTGIGLSINGEPVRGSSGNAGEIGRMLLSLGTDGRHGMDNDPYYLVEEAQMAGLLPPRPADLDLHALEAQFRQLCALALDGDTTAGRILRGAGGRIAEMVVMVAEVFDADTVIYGGPNWQFVRPFYEDLAVEALARPSARGPHPVRVESTAMGTQVGAIGAACAILDARFMPRGPGRPDPLFARK